MEQEGSWQSPNTTSLKPLIRPESSFPPGATQPIVGVYFTALYRALASSRTRLLDYTQRRATVGRTPLNEWSVAETSIWQNTTFTTFHAPGGIRTHDRSRWTAVDLCLRPRGYWERQKVRYSLQNTTTKAYLEPIHFSPDLRILFFKVYFNIILRSNM